METCGEKEKIEKATKRNFKTSLSNTTTNGVQRNLLIAYRPLIFKEPQKKKTSASPRLLFALRQEDDAFEQ